MARSKTAKFVCENRKCETRCGSATPYLCFSDVKYSLKQVLSSLLSIENKTVIEKLQQILLSNGGHLKFTEELTRIENILQGLIARWDGYRSP